MLPRLRVAAVWAALVTLLAFARPTWRSIAIGLPLVIAGEALRLWAAGHLTKTVELVTSGPYGYTRNPLYLGRLALLSGLCLMAELPHRMHWLALLAGWITFFGYYLPRKERVEPARLLEAHAEAYASYFAAVPALVPTRRRFAGSARRRWSAARCRSNREHWMVLGLALATAWLAWRV